MIVAVWKRFYCVDLIDLTIINHYIFYKIHKLCHLGHTKVVETLLRNGADASATNNNGDSTLQMAAFNGNKKKSDKSSPAPKQVTKRYNIEF